MNAIPPDREVIERMSNADYRSDYRSGYLESTLRALLNSMRGARSALTGKRHSFARDILDRDIADAEKTLRFCAEAKK